MSALIAAAEPTCGRWRPRPKPLGLARAACGNSGYARMPILFPVIAIRLAAEADAPALAKIAVAAYQHYVPRIGRPPAPMTADYTAAVRRGQAWVAAVDGEVAGFIILISRPGYLLLENVAVMPAA
jgi:GNAT superfamily N-acetyltransferase